MTRKLPTEDQPSSESRIDSRYSQATSTVVAFNIEVRCWSPDDWAAIRRETAALGAETSRTFFGVADAFEGVANLSPSTCESLDQLAYERRADPSPELVAALTSLGRESEHGAGEGRPKEAQCDALQDVRPLATGLGAAPADAASLASLAWRVYRTKQLEPQLWTAECRNEGPFDKNGRNVWP